MRYVLAAVGISVAMTLSADIAHADPGTPAIGTGGSITSSTGGSSCAVRQSPKFMPILRTGQATWPAPNSGVGCSR